MKHFVCYGGPIHGQSVKMLDGCEYIIPNRRPLTLSDWHQSSDRVEKPSFDVIVYRLQIWSYGATGPRRRKEYQFLLADGHTLTTQDRYELTDQLRGQPWAFPQVSFLNDFDEWFAQAVYRHTRQLYWKGKQVWEWQ